MGIMRRLGVATAALSVIAAGMGSTAQAEEPMPANINHDLLHGHWVSSDTGWSNQNVDHYGSWAPDTKYANLCGGYMAASIGGPNDFIIHHTHVAQRVSLPAGDPGKHSGPRVGWDTGLTI